MNILYDNIIFNFQRHGGISRYFSEVMRGLSSYNGARISLFKGVNIIPGRFTRLNSLLLDRKLKSSGFDIYHPTYYSANVKKRDSVKTVITVFDMIHEKSLMTYPGIDEEIKIKRRSISNADHIICISNTTKDDLKEIYKIEDDRITVTYLGSETGRMQEKGTSPNISKPYILYVGKRWFYKNFKILAQAFSALGLKEDFDLICFGGERFSDEEKTEFWKLGLQGVIRRIAGDDSLLQEYYKNAHLFVHTSLYEGFGLPVLEAMNNDCPVIASKGGSIPEIAGDSALFFLPDDIEELCMQLKMMIEDNGLREKYIKKGRERVKDFSWERTALDTYEVYKKVLSEKPV